jgi:hypothetical protein
VRSRVDGQRISRHACGPSEPTGGFPGRLILGCLVPDPAEAILWRTSCDRASSNDNAPGFQARRLLHGF